MPKENILIIFVLSLIVILVIVGYPEDGISIDLSDNPVTINKWGVHTQNFNFTSDYSGAQPITLNLSTNDPRIGVSWDGKYFGQIVHKEIDVGKNFQNKESFYIKVIDQNIPNGEYEINIQITVQKNKEVFSDKMSVRIGFK